MRNLIVIILALVGLGVMILWFQEMRKIKSNKKKRS